MVDQNAEFTPSPLGQPDVTKATKTAKILAEAAKAQGAPPAEAVIRGMDVATKGTAPVENHDETPL